MGESVVSLNPPDRLDGSDISEAETRLHAVTLSPQRTRVAGVPGEDWPAAFLLLGRWPQAGPAGMDL